MAVDFSKAFDTVDHNALLSCLQETSMDANTVRWLRTYLRGRTENCRYNGVDSCCVKLHQGVPQGSVLSPLLFGAYVATYPQTAELVISYADDFTAGVSCASVEDATTALANHAQDVATWAGEQKLQISTQKSTVTLFTSDRRQYSFHPQIPLNGTPLPLEKYPKILEITFDPLLCFHKHAETTADKCKQSLPILKALTGTDWGQQKETIVATYKATIDSRICYGPPIWSINASPSSIKSLQTVQNSA